MNYFSSIFMFLVLACLLGACQNKETQASDKQDDLSMYPMAKEFTVSDTLLKKLNPDYNFLEAPFFMGELKDENQKSIIIAPNRPASDIVTAIPMANIRLRVGNQIQSYLVSNGIVEKKAYLDCNNYEEFAVRYASIKQIIDLWLNNYQGMGKTKVEEWSPYKQAIQ